MNDEIAVSKKPKSDNQQFRSIKTYTIQKRYAFDTDYEKSRIIMNFDEEWQKLLNPIVDAFVSDNLDECRKLYDNLPYCSERHCSGRNFVSDDIVRAIDAHYHGAYVKVS